MPKTQQHPTTREKRRKRPWKAAEIIAILSAAAGLITAITHLIQALK